MGAREQDDEIEGEMTRERGRDDGRRGRGCCRGRGGNVAREKDSQVGVLEEGNEARLDRLPERAPMAEDWKQKLPLKSVKYQKRGDDVVWRWLHVLIRC